MFTLIGMLVLIGLVAWGFYLYMKVNEINRKIARYHGVPSKATDDR